MALLKLQTGPKAGATFPIQESTFTVGRDTSAQLLLSDHGASRLHAEIFRMGSLYFIRDLSSRNGTFVNDKRITEIVLREGDQIRIGETIGVFLESENSPTARILRVHEGSDPLETLRFRDTFVGSAGSPSPLSAAATAAKEPRKPNAAHLAATVAQILAAEPSLQAAFERTVAEIGKALEADRVDILFIELGKAGDQEVQVRSAATHDTNGVGEISISRTILREVIQRKEAVYTANAIADKRYMESVSIVAHTIRSVLCAPLLVDGAAVGVLYLCDSQKPNAFQEADVEAIAAVALELSAAISWQQRFEAREDVLRSSILLCLQRGRPCSEEELKRGVRVARYSRAIASALGLGHGGDCSAWVVGLLHHLVADLRSDGSRQELLASWPGVDAILDAIACQDERHDGSGAPAGKLGDEIPLLGRVLALAKELDRLVTASAASGESALDAALKTLRESAGQRFHPDVLEACFVGHRGGLLGSNFRAAVHGS